MIVPSRPSHPKRKPHFRPRSLDGTSHQLPSVLVSSHSAPPRVRAKTETCVTGIQDPRRCRPKAKIVPPTAAREPRPVVHHAHSRERRVVRPGAQCRPHGLGPLACVRRARRRFGAPGELWRDRGPPQGARGPVQRSVEYLLLPDVRQGLGVYRRASGRTRDLHAAARHHQVRGRSVSCSLEIFSLSLYSLLFCSAAPQKIMWMAWDRYRKTGRRDQIKVDYFTGTPTMFSVKKYSDALEALRVDRGVGGYFGRNLVSVDAANRKAVFKSVADGTEIKEDYTILHVTPPMGPLDVLKGSPISDAAGWIEVDKGTLQHVKPEYSNVFALGDASSLPTSKTAAAITKQAPVLTENLFRLLDSGKIGSAVYDGYTSCPVCFLWPNRLTWN
jgi:hypothetical protein